MKMNKLQTIFKGTSGDSFFLMSVRMVTMVFSLLMTRVLSGHFSLQDYGTYSQVMLLTTTLSSVTKFGLMDGVNFFFCREQDEQKRNSYISTIFFLQYAASAVTSLVLLSCTVPIAGYFGNESLKSLIIFAAVLPVLENTISLLQIMFIAVGKAKLIAVRNLVVSVLKLVAIMLACYVFDNIVVLLLWQTLMDTAQVVYFVFSLRKHNCRFNIFRFDKSLIKEILVYCIPMAMFSVIKTLNRDADKFVISFFTDTETLAVYTNASKVLPFDIVMASFCTVLVPYITRFIASKKYDATATLYRSFLEVSYISTTILAVGAICIAPELMRFLYTDKYTAEAFGIIVFIIYMLVDIIGVLNITLILSAAGKTKTVMLVSIGSFAANIAGNIVLFFALREVGPALTTLLVTLIQGIVMLSLCAREIKTKISGLLLGKPLLLFLGQLLVCFALASGLRMLLNRLHLHYTVVLILVYGVFAGAMFLLNFRRLMGVLGTINRCKAEEPAT